MQRRAAFTLIELLVVIAIIAILASILFPVFARAREQARKAQCGSNVRQLALAAIMYSSDYDETFPGMDERGDEGDAHPLLGEKFNGSTPNGGQPYYAENKFCPADQLSPYTKNDGIFQCANLDQRVVRHTYPNYANKVYRGDGTSTEARAGSYLWFCAHACIPQGPVAQFCVNSMGKPSSRFTNIGSLYTLLVAVGILAPLPPDNYAVCGQTQSAIARPAQKPMFIDDTWGTNHEGFPNSPIYFLPKGALCALVTGNPNACNPISTGWNTGYADGHAKYTKTSFYQTVDLWLHPNAE